MKLLFSSPSFVSLFQCRCGEHEVLDGCHYLPWRKLHFPRSTYVAHEWKEILMYLEPNLWKSLKAKTELVWEPVECMLNLLVCSLWGFPLGECSRVGWSFCCFHSVPHDINPRGTSSPGKLETGETYHCCQDIVSVARSPNRIRFKVSY